MRKKPGGNAPPNLPPTPPPDPHRGPLESRILLALGGHLGESVHYSLQHVGRSAEARKAWHALRAMPPPEWDRVMTFAAAGLLPKVIDALPDPDDPGNG